MSRDEQHVTSDQLDELCTAFGNAEIEAIDPEQKHQRRTSLDLRGEGSDDVVLDLTPGAIDRTDPIRNISTRDRSGASADPRGRGRAR